MTGVKRLRLRMVVVLSGLLLLCLMAAMAAAVAIGSVPIAWRDLCQLLGDRFFGAYAQATSDLSVIIFSLRVPRIVLAAVVGAGLSTAGAAFQALLRNPLADPYVLGVSSGAAFGILLTTLGIGLITASPPPFLLALTRPLAAFLGALLVITAVYFMAGGSGGAATHRLLLAGSIMGSFLASVNTLLLLKSNQHDLHSFLFWMIGDLGRPIDDALPWVASIVLMGSLTIYLFARSLNLMAVSEAEALALGVNVARVRTSVYIITSLMTGVIVSFSGSIAYIGLIVPHLVRRLFRSDYRVLVPMAFFSGALFTVIADTIARTIISPTELPVGVITALCGAPVFVYLLRKRGA